MSSDLFSPGAQLNVPGGGGTTNITNNSGILDVVIAGNTSGTTASISSGTMLLAGGNNITLSQNGNSVTVVGGGGGSNGIAAISGGNTAGNTGSVSLGSLYLAGGNNVTLSGSTAASAITVTISAFNQSVQTQNLIDVSLSGNTSGTLALISSGTLILAGGNNITLSQNGQSVTISGPNTAAQTNQSLGIYASSQTFGQSSSSTYDARSLSIVGSGEISVGWSNSSFLISAPTQSVQTQNLFDLTLSGNTSGTLALISSGTMTLAGGNNITLSQNGNAVTISAAGGGGSAGISGGNTSGNTGTIALGALYLAGGNQITLSGSTAAGAETVTISAANQSADTAGIYASSQTTGASSSSTYDVRSLSLAYSGGLSGGWTNGSYLQNDGWNTRSQWYAAPHGIVLIATNVAPALSTITFWPADINGFFSASQANGLISISLSTSATNNSTANGTIALSVGIYTRNVSTLSLASSGSQSIAWSFTSNASNASLSGARFFSVPINALLTPGDYWYAALWGSSSGGNLGFTMSQVAQQIGTGAAFSGYFPGSSNATSQFGLGLGIFSSGALPASVAFSTITGATAGSVRVIPQIAFMNMTV